MSAFRRKTCVGCRKRKLLTEFKSRRYRSKSGDRIYYNGECLNCLSIRMKKYYKRNKHRWNESRRKNPEHHLILCKRYFAKLKRETLSAYGDKCVCCGETSPEFLTIEHGLHDGKAHREKVHQRIYADLRKRGFPQDIGITILCWNCNMATRFGELCPHQKAKP